MLSPVELIKEKLSIVDVVGSYVKLVKAGKNYKALSPFSNEKTPSFFVSPSRDMYYCFSTSQGGDIFTFVEKMEGVDFSGALRILAERAGVDITHESKEVRDRRSRLYSALEKASALYRHFLSGRDEVCAYLKERGLSDATIERFGLGYAQHEWRILYERLRGEGFSERELLDVGLIKKTEKEGKTTYYDTFRGRIMFPIADSAGRIVGFSGRILPSLDDGKTGKYINSPETPLYNKSRILYGYNKAKGGIKKFNFSILVEGQMDVLLSHQAGYPNTVGVSGTSLTVEQLALLSRLSKNIVMAFDADRAGFASAGRSASLALSMGMNVKVARLPKGVDPALLIKEDKGAWRDAIKGASHIVEFYLTELREEEKDERKFKLRVQEIVLPFVASIRNRIDQTHFVQLVARSIGVSEEVIREEISLMEEHSSNSKGRIGAHEENRAPVPRVLAERKLADIILWQQALETPLIDVEDLKGTVEAILGKEKLKELLLVPKEQKEQDVLKTELLYENEQELKEDIEEMIYHLTRRFSKKELEETIQALREAERLGDSEAITHLLKKSQDIANKLKEYLGKKL